jgi:hypothetical protein
VPKAITEASIKALSLIGKFDDGIEYEPRNMQSRVLFVKGGEKKKPSFLERLLQKAGVFPVSADVPDDIDSDNDGSDDYNEIVQNVCSLYYDLQAACQIQDENARSMAIKTAIDGFKEEFLEMCAGAEDDESAKAGARHSAADKASIDAIGEHAAKAKEHSDALSTHVAAMVAEHGRLTATPAKDQTAEENADGTTEAKATAVLEPPEPPADGDPPKDPDAEKAAKAALSYTPTPGTETARLAADEKAAKDDKKPAGDYGAHADAGYADPGLQEDKKPRYPLKNGGKIDEERVRAAWSYINKEKNASAYSPGDLAKIKATIMAACKSLGIDVSDDKAAPIEPEPVIEPEQPKAAAEPEPTNKAGASAEEVEMTEDQLTALIAAAATKGAEAVMKASQAQIDALKADIEKSQEASALWADAQKKSIAEMQAKAALAEADLIATRAESEAAKAEAKKAQEAAKAMGVNAQKPSVAAYSAPATGEESRLSKVIKAQMVVNPQSHAF